MVHPKKLTWIEVIPLSHMVTFKHSIIDDNKILCKPKKKKLMETLFEVIM